MSQHPLIQLLLAPLTVLYGIGVALRLWLYKKKVLKRVAFDIPIISVGNLSAGGAGKTPHIEFLVEWLKEYIQLATLSRGYKRKTKGFLVATNKDDANSLGDEPYQYFQKYGKDVTVAVCEERVFAIPELLKMRPDLQAILLDDAFQHLPIAPGLNILLTTFEHPFTKDYLLPSGRLREFRSSYERADVIVISKCPTLLDQQQRRAWLAAIKPLPHQQLYFTYYDYGKAYHILDPSKQLTFTPDHNLLTICAIANVDYLVDYLNKKAGYVRLMEYADHHYFTQFEMGRLLDTYKKWDLDNKIILTTEKDATRLLLHQAFIAEQQLPIYVLPISVKFHFEESEMFRQRIQQFLLDFQV